MKRKEMGSSASETSAAKEFSTHSGTIQKSTPETDRQIESMFQNTFVNKTFLKDDSVKATAEKGVVTLTGTVSEESHKVLASKTAAHLPNVISVDNQMATTAEVASENADTWIGRKVNLTLLFHFHVNASGTTIEVKDRVVTLKGIASSSAQKDLTTEYASDIEGVKMVLNEMTVAPPPEQPMRSTKMKLDDASINALVHTALMTHHSTSSLNAKVETRKGEVLLTGIARNQAEKVLVTKLVTDIHGVNNVKNQMTVEEPKTR